MCPRAPYNVFFSASTIPALMVDMHCFHGDAFCRVPRHALASYCCCASSCSPLVEKYQVNWSPHAPNEDLISHCIISSHLIEYFLLSCMSPCHGDSTHLPSGPACSASHIPGYLNSPSLKSAGQVFVVSVNDAFVMKAWGATLDPTNKSGVCVSRILIHIFTATSEIRHLL